MERRVVLPSRQGICTKLPWHLSGWWRGCRLCLQPPLSGRRPGCTGPSPPGFVRRSDGVNLVAGGKWTAANFPRADEEVRVVFVGGKWELQEQSNGRT
eukprot:1457340-Amphidinium_carterae.1